MSILVPQATAAGPRGLYVACRECLKDFRSSELVGRLCVTCRVHQRCAEVRGELETFIRKQRRYAAAGAAVKPEQLERLKRRLIRRIQEVAPDPRMGMELFEKELQAALAPTGVVSRGRVLEVVQASQLLR